MKFELDGDIKDPQDSEYLKQIAEHKSAQYRLWLGITIVLLITSLGIMFWQFSTIEKLSISVNKYKVNETTNVDALIKQQGMETDSLRGIIENIEHKNAVLREQVEIDHGIFYEVHTSFDGNFDLKEYKSAIQESLLLEYDKRDMLLLGRFKSFQKALLFENDLKKSGLKNVYLIGRVDGRIMTYKEALAIDRNQNN